MDYTQIILAFITTVLGGKFLWDYLSKTRALRNKEKLAKMSMYSGDKKELLSYLEKQNEILTKKIDALEQECAKLRAENKEHAAQIAVLNERVWHYANKSRGSKGKMGGTNIKKTP